MLFVSNLIKNRFAYQFPCKGLFFAKRACFSSLAFVSYLSGKQVRIVVVTFTYSDNLSEPISMVHPAIQKRILDQLSQLAFEKQQQVLAFAEALGNQSIKGLPGNAYLRFAGLINEEDAASIKNAVEEGCEQVDENEW